MTNSAQKIGNYNVAALGTVTIGTWGNLAENSGIWYNYEGFNYGNFSQHVSVSIMLSQQQLSSMNTTIASSNSWNLLTNTCATFAVKVWNSVSSNKLSSTIKPSALATQIKTKFSGTYRNNKVIPTKTRSDIARQTSSGVVQCSMPTSTGMSGVIINSMR